MILSKYNLKILIRYIKEYYLIKNLIFKSNSKVILTKFPILTNYNEFHELNYHYAYHSAWALRKLMEISPNYHIDLASQIDFSLALSALIPVERHDFQKVNLKIKNFKSKSTNLQSLPFIDESIKSLSCMHAIEHIGLGRYGDPINLNGDSIAINELIRVLAVEGYLLFVVPVSEVNRIDFNAHRVYSYKYIIEKFSSLKLIEFSLVTDRGEFIENCDHFKVAA